MTRDFHYISVYQVLVGDLHRPLTSDQEAVIPKIDSCIDRQFHPNTSATSMPIPLTKVPNRKRLSLAIALVV